MRLRQLRDNYPANVELAHRAFMLLPEDQERTFTPYYLRHRQAARQMTGLPYDLPSVGAKYPLSSRQALEAAKWVETRYPDRFDAFDLALFEAFFQHTKDISDIDVLSGLAVETGMPGEEMTDALRAGSMAEAVWADHYTALEVGVTGIPCVLIGSRAISGAVSYEEYEQALRGALSGVAAESGLPLSRRRLPVY